MADDGEEDFTWVDRGDAALCSWLHALRAQRSHFEATLRDLCAGGGSLHAVCFTNGLSHLGLNRAGAGGWFYREWAPAATACSLVGDFNGWDTSRHPCQRDASGVFEVFVPDDGPWPLRAGGRYKAALSVRSRNPSEGERLVHRVPAWCRRTVQDPTTGELFAVAVAPETLLSYSWRHARPEPSSHPPLRVYEAHVGMSSTEPVIAGWSHFRAHVLPRVVALGYTALLLLGVAEHGYYGSFGYQVTSFFAPSSRFGSPAELQALIDAAHGYTTPPRHPLAPGLCMAFVRRGVYFGHCRGFFVAVLRVRVCGRYGLLVLFEIVHAHASSNEEEGLSVFDGSDSQCAAAP